ncbi:MAG: hypothetical protein ABI759_26120 [Candidatus Solibacter sp.]
MVFLLFLISRLALVTAHQLGSTLATVNVRYAAEAQRAARQGVSFYRLHEEARRLEDPQSVPEERVIEYPPLAILWMKSTASFLGPAPPSGPLPPDYIKSASFANQAAMFLVDVCGFAILLLAGAGAAQLGVYTLGGLLLFPILYDRMDLLLGVLLLAAILLLLRVRSPWPAFAVLAVAINFKMTPLVLVPLFLLGTLPAGALAGPVTFRTWRLILRNALVLGLIGVALFLPFFLHDGKDTLGFLSYHAKRGLEIASVWNTVPIALGAAVRWPVSASLRFGAVEINCPWTGALRKLASFFTAAVIPALAIALWMLLRHRVSSPGNPKLTMAQANPIFFTRCAGLCLLTATVFAPVFSPQYLLWLVPVAPLWEGKSRWWAWAAFLTICGLTTVHYPFFTGKVLGALSVEDAMPLWGRLLWPAPLILRNLALVVFTAWFWVDTRSSTSGHHPPVRTI